MEIANPTLYAVILLIINGGIQWIRELRKGGTQKKNGKDLKEIKDDIKSVAGKVDSLGLKMVGVKTAVESQKTNCAATIKRFDKAIGDQNQTLIDLAGRKR